MPTKPFERFLLRLLLLYSPFQVYFFCYSFSFSSRIKQKLDFYQRVYLANDDDEALRFYNNSHEYVPKTRAKNKKEELKRQRVVGPFKKSIHYTSTECNKEYEKLSRQKQNDDWEKKSQGINTIGWAFLIAFQRWHFDDFNLYIVSGCVVAYKICLFYICHIDTALV